MPDVDHWPATEPTRFDTTLDVLEDLRGRLGNALAQIQDEMTQTSNELWRIDEEYAVAKDEAAEAKSREELARELLEALRREVEENRGKDPGKQ